MDAAQLIFNHIKQLKADGKRIGITFSTFDMLHAGHIAMLSEAKNHCDYLIAGLQTDPTIDRPTEKNPPVQSIVERQIQLAACRYVDEVVVYQTEEDLVDLLLILPVDVRILGVESRPKFHRARRMHKSRHRTGIQWQGSFILQFKPASKSSQSRSRTRPYTKIRKISWIYNPKTPAADISMSAL